MYSILLAAATMAPAQNPVCPVCPPQAPAPSAYASPYSFPGAFTSPYAGAVLSGAGCSGGGVGFSSPAYYSSPFGWSPPAVSESRFTPYTAPPGFQYVLPSPPAIYAIPFYTVPYTAPRRGLHVNASVNVGRGRW